MLLDEDSPFAGAIGEAVLLHRRTKGAEDERERHAIEDTAKVLRERLPALQLHLEPWPGDDPTDHRAIFGFLRQKVPELRRRFSGRELVIHISPGTPSMQTLWVLMAETGFVEPPFVLVKSYRKAERHGRPAVVPVELGIETFYKVYKAARARSRPRNRASSGTRRDFVPSGCGSFSPKPAASRASTSPFCYSASEVRGRRRSQTGSGSTAPFGGKLRIVTGRP